MEALSELIGRMYHHGLQAAGWQACLTEGYAQDTDVVRILGNCNFDDKIISLSVKGLNHRSPAQIRDTILHEIAHALVGYSEDPHGPAWQAKADEIGVRTFAILNASAYDELLAHTNPENSTNSPAGARKENPCSPPTS